MALKALTRLGEIRIQFVKKTGIWWTKQKPLKLYDKDVRQ